MTLEIILVACALLLSGLWAAAASLARARHQAERWARGIERSWARAQERRDTWP